MVRRSQRGWSFREWLLVTSHSTGWASLGTQLVKNPSAMRETWVSSLGREDALEKGVAIHSSISACRIPWTEEPGGLERGVMKSRTWLRD